MKLFWSSFIFALIPIITKAQGCEDQNFQLSDDGVTFYTCSQIITDKPQWCAPDFVMGGQTGIIASTYCCASCSSLGTIPTCYDGGVTFPIGGVSYSCSQLAAQFPEKCANSVTYNGVSQLISDICCESCSSVVTSTFPTCADKSGIVFTFNSVNYTCQQLAVSLPEHCLESIVLGGESVLISEVCCESCNSVTIPTCYDSASFKLIYNGAYHDCSEISSEMPQLCNYVLTDASGEPYTVAEKCCESCSSVDIPTCVDDDGFMLNEMSCPEIASQRPQDCVKVIQSGGVNYDVAQLCCESCSSVVIPTCYDDSDSGWFIRVGSTNITDCPSAVAAAPGLCAPGEFLEDKCCVSCGNWELRTTAVLPTCSDAQTGMFYYYLAPVNYTDCTILTSAYPQLCLTSSFVQTVCCESCNALGTISTCYDRIGLLVNGLTCAEVADQRPYYCDQTFTLTNPEGVQESVGIGQACCESCAGVTIPTCYDTPNPISLTLGTAVYTDIDCQTLIAEAAQACILSAEVADACCESCRSLGPYPTCYDVNIGLTITFDGTVYTDCPTLVQDYPTACSDSDVADKCCQSCSDGGCTDDPDFLVDIGGTNPKSCNQIAKRENRIEKACCTDYIGTSNGEEKLASEACCATCQLSSCAPGTQPTCTDNALFSVSISGVQHTCSQIASDVPQYCDDIVTDSSVDPPKDYNIAVECCASCSAVTIPTCYDQVGFYVTADDGTKLYCADIASQRPYYCLKTLTEGGQQYPIDQFCCESCRDAVIPSCYDEVDGWPIILGDLSFANCAEVIDQIPHYCAIGEVVPQKCCESCSTLDTIPTCYDNTPGTWSFDVGSVTYDDCALLTQDYPEYCESSNFVQDVCCDTCQTTVIPTCYDTYGFILDITSENLQFTCAEIAAQRPYYCDDTITVSNGQIINIGEYCCESCSGVDTPTCYDRPPGWTFTYGTTAFTDCQSLVDTIPWYCERDDTGIPEYCCETCSNTVIPSCYDLPANTGWYLNVSGVIYTDCADIYADHPSYCDTNSWVQTNCCAACRDSGTVCEDDPDFLITIGKSDKSCAQLSTYNKKRKACCQGRTGTDGVLGTVGCCATCEAFICP